MSLLIALGMPWVAAQANADDDLTAFSIEELMGMEITSVSRKSEPMSNAAAAIYVITQEDIRRSGVKSIPDALRMVPGLNVASSDANKWAIASRGLNHRFARHLLVLIDGRSVYDTMFSGVYWDAQDTDLASVERIEVIRGPGGTMWGSNAVNGVINIITKKAEDTSGAHLTIGAGTQESAFGSARWGGKLGDRVNYRVFGKYFKRSDYVDSHNDKARDGWKVGRAGIRFDWDLSEDDDVSLMGEWYNGFVKQRIKTALYPVPPVSATIDDENQLSGGHLSARWAHRISDTSELAIKAYYDRSERRETYLNWKFDTFDFDFQHRFALAGRHDIVWGTGYRRVRDSMHNTFIATLTPDHRAQDFLSFFGQDQISLIPDLLSLTLGLKLERNDYTHWEYQPNARLLWSPHPRHRVWAAVSRAVKTPSRSDTAVRFVNVVIDSGTDIIAGYQGDRQIESEDLLAYELGYRVQLSDNASLDLASYMHVYDQLITAEAGTLTLDTSYSPAALVNFATLARKGEGKIWGLEAAGNWNVSERWRLRGGYTFAKANFSRKDSSTAAGSRNTGEGDFPHHQFQLRSFYDLTETLELDTMLYVVGNMADRDTHSYTRLDVRLGWKPRPGIELSLALQNLLESRHKEFDDGDDGQLASEVPRGAYAQVTWKF